MSINETLLKKYTSDLITGITESFTEMHELFNNRNKKEVEYLKNDTAVKLTENFEGYNGAMYSLIGAIGLDILLGYAGTNYALEHLIGFPRTTLLSTLATTIALSTLLISGSRYAMISHLKEQKSDTGYKTWQMPFLVWFIPQLVMPTFTITHLYSYHESWISFWSLSGTVAAFAIFMCGLTYRSARDIVRYGGRKAREKYLKAKTLKEELEDIEVKAGELKSNILKKGRDMYSEIPQVEFKKTLEKLPLEDRIIMDHEFLGEPLVDYKDDKVTFHVESYPFIGWWDKL